MYNAYNQKFNMSDANSVVMLADSHVTKAHIRLEIKIEIELDFDQSKRSSLNLRLVFFLIG